MDINSIIGTGIVVAGGGTIAYTLINSLKGLPSVIWKKVKGRLVYTVRVYQYDDLFDMIDKWFYHNHSQLYRDVEAILNTEYEYTSSQSDKPGHSLTIKTTKSSAIRYKQEDNAFIFKYKGKRILITKTSEKLDKANVSIKDIRFHKFVFSGFKAKKEISALLEEIHKFSVAEKDENTIDIYSNTTWGEWRKRSTKSVKPLSTTILNKKDKDLIVHDIDKFENAKDWYLSTGIPYKRGYCLYGPPGTGKTTLALAIANYTGRKVYALNLNSLEDDTKLPACFSDIPDKAILLIEDIDKVFSGRENVSDKSKVTFSSFLNCLDGVFYRQGLITIITTNHIEKLDEALLRCGRIDVKIDIPLPSDNEISEYLSLFYDQDVKIVGKFGLKMSEVQEICLQNKDFPEKAKESIYSHLKKNGKLVENANN